MAAGRKDRLITIERATTTRNEFGELIEQWEILASVYAEEIERLVNEQWRAEQLAAETRLQFKAWWTSDLSDLSPVDRLMFEEQTYQILGVQEIGRRRELLITAVARSE